MPTLDELLDDFEIADEGVAYCVHDWSVPAAEEMLAIHLLLKLPGYEGELRFLH